MFEKAKKKWELTRANANNDAEITRATKRRRPRSVATNEPKQSILQGLPTNRTVEKRVDACHLRVILRYFNAEQRFFPPQSTGGHSVTGSTEDVRGKISMVAHKEYRYIYPAVVQPPPRQTQRAVFPHWAFLPASCQSLWDLSCWLGFRPRPQPRNERFPSSESASVICFCFGHRKARLEGG
jgi:hypothetical protein